MKYHLSSLVIGLLLSWTDTAASVAPMPVNWNPMLPDESPVTVEWQESEKTRILKVVNTAEAPIFVTLATIEKPPIESEFYGIDGRVKYEIEGAPGILEMWNHFPGKDGGQPTAHFSRTMANDGLLKNLSGRSDWRDYRLPFNAKGSHAHPSKLVINLHFASKGTVYLEPATLREFKNFGEMVTAAGAWWSVTWSGWIGGGLGALFGCFGGLLGLLSRKGQARGFVLGSSCVMMVIGVVFLLVGITAFAVSQPYHVFYPFLLLGVILSVVMFGTRKQMRANYQAAEERRMAAMDAISSSAD